MFSTVHSSEQLSMWRGTQVPSAVDHVILNVHVTQLTFDPRNTRVIPTIPIPGVENSWSKSGA